MGEGRGKPENNRTGKKIRKKEKERAELRSLQFQPRQVGGRGRTLPRRHGAGSVSLVPENSQASSLVNPAVRRCPLKQCRKARANTRVVMSTTIHTHTRGRREDIKRINC